MNEEQDEMHILGKTFTTDYSAITLSTYAGSPLFFLLRLFILSFLAVTLRRLRLIALEQHWNAFLVASESRVL